MRHARAPLAAALSIISLLALAAPASALSGAPGGVQAPSAPQAGGSEFGVPARVPGLQRPVIGRLSVPATASPGSPPRVTVEVNEQGVGTVYVEVAVNSLSTRRPAVVARLGWVSAGRALNVRWPTGAGLAPGSYHVSVSAHDHHGRSLLRRAHSSGVATLTVKAPPAPPPAVAPTVQPAPPAPPTGVPTPAQTVAAGAVFPVAGPHDFGGPEDRFGAPRGEHIHQGQDVLTAEGTPVLAPLAGAITWTSYQAGGAGYYAVEHTAVGFDLMFAHCQAGSLAVAAGQTVASGQLLCHAGQTGDATAPHLHFEMWVGGWQAAGGQPIDPLPYLEAWERR